MNLKEGSYYTLKFFEQVESHKRKQMVKKRMRLIKCYTHHAVFEDSLGILTSYRYWDLEKLLKGELR